MFCYACIGFCTNAACVVNICSLIKILTNHFILFSG